MHVARSGQGSGSPSLTQHGCRVSTCTACLPSPILPAPVTSSEHHDPPPVQQGDRRSHRSTCSQPSAWYSEAADGGAPDPVTSARREGDSVLAPPALGPRPCPRIRWSGWGRRRLLHRAVTSASGCDWSGSQQNNPPCREQLRDSPALGWKRHRTKPMHELAEELRPRGIKGPRPQEGGSAAVSSRDGTGVPGQHGARGLRSHEEGEEQKPKSGEGTLCAATALGLLAESRAALLRGERGAKGPRRSGS